MADNRRLKRNKSRSSTLSYAVRVRDLLHGFVYLTQPEVDVIDHPLFQRLRHVRQNDLASYVYPSLNTSRFEHSLGTTHVAGKMAFNLTHSRAWRGYKRAVGLSNEDFQQVCRLYALLHDVGHLPLSHLFETAVEDYVRTFRRSESLHELCEEWFGGSGFSKLHEACGSVVARVILKTVNASNEVKRKVLYLMETKVLPRDDNLWPIKQLVDSEIDADRIDSTARDGLLAGGEYGTYDIERLCSSVFVYKSEKGWRLVYSHKALGSIEGLLLDRLRMYTWVHFHHRKVAVATSARFLIRKLLCEKVITKRSFPVTEPAKMALRDDVWLLSLLRSYKPQGRLDIATRTALDNLFFRKKENVTLLWKNRAAYNALHKQLQEQAGVREPIKVDEILRRGYEERLAQNLKATVSVFNLGFQPVEKGLVYLSDEKGGGVVGELVDHSTLIESLKKVWEGEPRYHVVVLGKSSAERDSLCDKWLTTTVSWLSERSHDT